MKLDHLRSIRDYELEQVLRFFPADVRVLELGAGAGWQSRALATRGLEVIAVDIPQSQYSQVSAYPVLLYDGTRLPFAPDTFDLVYSSNVLEHIPQLNTMESEILRVLKDNGLALHIVPSASWRVWTSLTHHLYIARMLIRLLFSDPAKSGEGDNPSPPLSRHPVSKLVSLALWPHRHGERGNSLSEIRLFSRGAWSRHFTESGWRVRQSLPLGLFYTGNEVLGARLPLPVRTRLSRFLGSSTTLFVLEKMQGKPAV